MLLLKRNLFQQFLLMSSELFLASSSSPSQLIDCMLTSRNAEGIAAALVSALSGRPRTVELAQNSLLSLVEAGGASQVIVLTHSFSSSNSSDCFIRECSTWKNGSR